VIVFVHLDPEVRLYIKYTQLGLVLVIGNKFMDAYRIKCIRVCLTVFSTLRAINLSLKVLLLAAIAIGL